MDYFKHYSTASDSKSLNTIFDKFGHKGIAFWWMLVELCSENWDGQGTPEFVFHQRTVASKLKSSPNSVRPWLELCSNLGMCAFAHFETQFEIKMPKLLEIKTSRSVIKSNKNQLPVYKNRIEENRIDKEGDAPSASNISEIATSKKAPKKNLPKTQTQKIPKPILFEPEAPSLEEDIELSDLARNVLTALNSICDKSFRPTQGNMKFINARCNEKYKFEDFVSVIKFKQEQWANDVKMRAYLRPETIFGTKFDSYLQESKNADKPISDPLYDLFIRNGCEPMEAV